LSRSDSTDRLGRVRFEPRTNERAKPSARTRLGRSELGQDRVNVEKGRWLFVSQEGTQAAPRPVLRITNQAGPYRVECDVPMHLECMTLALDEYGTEASVEDMAALAPVPIRPLRIPPVEVLHSGRDVRLRGGDEKVIVRREEAIGTAGPAEPSHAQLEQREELCALLIITKDDPSEVGMGRDVVETAGNLEARRARHTTTVRPSGRHGGRVLVSAQSWRGFAWGQTP
jgi:hypothetical protein